MAHQLRLRYFLSKILWLNNMKHLKDRTLIDSDSDTSVLLSEMTLIKCFRSLQFHHSHYLVVIQLAMNKGKRTICTLVLICQLIHSFFLEDYIIIISRLKNAKI